MARPVKRARPTSWLVLSGALALGWTLRGLEAHDGAQASAHFMREGAQGLTRPLIDCEAPRGGADGELEPLRASMVSAAEEARRAGLVEQISVYYRDLADGRWIGLDEDARFTPASLLKVAVLITLFKEAQDKPGVLDRRRVYAGAAPSPWVQDVAPGARLVAGETYTLDRLAEQMIVESDNQAEELVEADLEPTALVRTFEDLGVPFPARGKTPSEDFMSPKEYSAFLRALYNRGYLGRELSERALALLSEVRFGAALRAGIPPWVPVAHKFGEREYEKAGTGTRDQLHDCGIVYSPRRPYLLCVMTRGKRFEGLAEGIARMARAVEAAHVSRAAGG